MDEGRGGLLSAGGILSIIVGAFEILGGGMMALMCLRIPLRLGLISFLPGIPRPWFEHCIGVIPIWLIIVGGLFVVLGIIAIVGGVSAIRRRSFGLSLAGAICALVPLNFLGLLAVIFIGLGKREF